MGIIDYINSPQKMGLVISNEKLNPDEFKLDGEKFEGLGHGMLKSQNQLNYVSSPSRQTDGSMLNINDYDSFIIPKVEMGFKLIDYNTYLKLRKYLLAKRTFKVDYFDKDFNKIVSHEMYAEPDDLTNFFNLGENIIGSQDFVFRLIATLNEEDKYTAKYFVGGSVREEKKAKWGRPIQTPNNDGKSGYWKAISSNFYSGLKIREGEQFNIVENVEFHWESE